MTRSRVRAIFAVSAFASVVLALAVPCPSFTAQASATASPTIKAVGTWSMVSQTRSSGSNTISGDGGVPTHGALSAQPSGTYVGAGNHIAQPNERLINGNLSWYLPDGLYSVQLNACRSIGTQFRWTIANAAGSQNTAWQSMKSCRQLTHLAEGHYMLTLHVRTGPNTASTTVSADVRALLIVALGDSYASGEGNPRNVDAFLNSPTLFSPFTAYWDDEQCHRSVLGAPAQAALALQRDNPHVAVTLVDVSCSGATIDSGLLGPQRAIGQMQSQLEQVRQIVGAHRIDAITVSIGGNDIGFGSILQSCALQSDCPLQKPLTGPLAGSATVQTGVQNALAKLGREFITLNAALRAIAPQAVILPTLYPDITRAANGSPCSYLSIAPADFAWARDAILDPAASGAYSYTTSSGVQVPMPLPHGTLNSQVLATQSLGWVPIVRTWGASGNSVIGHGVCAGDQAWAYGLISFGQMATAAFHPNPAGLSQMAQAITAELATQLRTRA